MFDLHIRRGLVVDGSGQPTFVADVGVRNRQIAEFGVSGPATNEIDAQGLIVTPDFIDIHSHYDGQAIWESRLAPSSEHGVTTVLTGNCGVGFTGMLPGRVLGQHARSEQQQSQGGHHDV